MNIWTILIVISLVLALLFRNVSFVVLFSPVVKCFFFFKQRQQMLPQRETYIPKSGHRDTLFQCVKELLSGFVAYYMLRLSYTPSHRLRNFFYRKVCGLKIQAGAVVYYGAEIRDPQKVVIGQGSIIGDRAVLDGRNGIVIGENVVLASEVRIWTEQHDHRDPYFRCDTQQHGPVIIGDRAWIGSHTVILNSVQIGEGAVVASGAVVTHSVPPFAIVAGVPAKAIGERNHDLRYTFDGSHRHFI